MILSANVLTLLCRQYSHEIANSLFYASLQSWAEMRGLDGTAAYMAHQAAHEREHADMVLGYIHDRNEQLTIAGLDLPPASPASFVDLFMLAQARERLTTDMIAEICTQADAEGDWLTRAWLMQPAGLAMEQIEEERTIQTILDRIAARRGMVPLDASEGIDMAEMPGNVVHDIDCWIKGLA
jgi:ferritin